MNIHIFYHLYCTESSIELFTDTFIKIKESGLYDNLETIHVNLVGPYFEHVKNDSIFNDIKIKITNLNIDEMSEADTLNILKSKCGKLKDTYVLYLHSKGASKPGNKNIKAWKDYMEYFNISKWVDCIDKLHLDGYTTCGVNLQQEGDGHPHYSGNFWWAKAEYINTLDNIPYNTRWYCEMWVLDNINSNPCCLHNSGINHYLECYSESQYKT